MSIFNNDDFIDDTENLTLDGLISLDLFHKKDEQITVNYGLQLNSNTFIDDKIIEKNEMKQLENIDVNIKSKLTELSSNIGGVYTNNNNYSGNNIYLGSSSFNQMSLTTNGITKNLDSFELSQLDNISSNIQTQLNNKINKIANPTLNNIVSMDISGNCVNNDVQITTDNNLNITSDKIIPSSTSIKNYVDNKINNLSYQSVVGEGINLYFSNTTNNLSGYEDLLYTPDSSSEDIEVITLNNNRVLLHSYATSSLNRTIIPSGIYSFHFYCYVNDNISLTRFEIELYKIDLSNNLTQIGTTILSPDVNFLNVNNLTFNYTLQNNISCNYTDKFIIKIFGFSNVSTKTILLYFYHSGSRHNSFISTPFIYKHNDLSNLDDVNGNYHHLTLLQKQKATQYSSTSNDGILNTTDFNIFNNKENYITPSTINHYYRGDKTFQLLNKNSVGLSNIDNTSDINKPISTATQIALNLKNDIINSSTNLTLNSITDNIGNIRTGINNLTNKFYQLIYIAGQFGSDTNLGYTINNPKQTIQNALNDNLSNTGINLIISPWIYNENITISRQNITISSIIYEKGGLVNISGDTTITSVNSSVRLSGITFNNLIITGNTNVYIDNCKIGGILNKTGSGYLEVNNSSLSGQILLNSNSVNNFLNNNIAGTISNNSTYNSLQCNFSNNLITGLNVNINSGIWGFSNSVIYSSSVNVFSLMTNNVYLYLSNMSMLNPDNTPSKISLTNTYYSINNSYYNKTNSLFITSTKLNRTQHNEIMNIDTIYLNSFLNVNNINITPVQLSYLNGLTSNIQTQINNIDVSNYVSLNGIQTLTNKTLTDPKLTNNIIKSSTNNNISFIDSGDTIVNLNSTQTLTNKTLTNPILTNNIIKSSTNNNFTFLDISDNIVNENSTQTLNNKTLTNPKLSNNIIKSSTDKNITFIDSVDTIVNLNSTQTLQNKTLSLNCEAVTPNQGDISQKIATTSFVKFALSNNMVYKFSIVGSLPLILPFEGYELKLFYSGVNRPNLHFRTIYNITVPISGSCEISLTGNGVRGNISEQNYNNVFSTLFMTDVAFYLDSNNNTFNSYIFDSSNIYHIIIIRFNFNQYSLVVSKYH